ncbi:unnamed protein product [Tetraodon nigroviridis]|uniref:(spotted green pufferfish) hypothetical protein n=1 Tax=Tetraodon nigroviridis TaxID=99883 RepID=Q4SU58_TETNG|nr:unnamed protein product [Tetraodon nigroviridis]
MDFNNLLQKAATDQLQQKAVEAAEGIIKKAMGGDEDKEDKEDGDKKGSGFDVGDIIQNVTRRQRRQRRSAGEGHFTFQIRSSEADWPLIPAPDPGP